ncbi:MAG TPA: asparagine synthase (glutamine-hydrolyzing) [Chitinophagaceae bacterium]|nr:asparagine synthase (glutamine-hydrolyzing) [Chitinophagaceae bacterium]
MCGIAGFLSSTYNKEDLYRITRCIRHRGPDAEGFYFNAEDGIGLGHRRLSIIDLSEAANQPFYSQDGRYIMIFNGEVYNFKEVAAKYNIKPRTNSDSEIIIEAFSRAGISSINDLNGMFTIIIWDKEEKKLWLIRDRIGIKPLYYYYHDGNFAFASELKAIFSLSIQKEINNNSIINFLYLGYIPGEETIYTSCKKIKPGHYAIADKNGLQIKPYWQLEDKLLPCVISDEQAAHTTLKNLVQSSIKYCMISDVPLGIFLSGGVDSSLVAAVAQSVSNLPVKTFSIAFEDKKYNESVFAQQVANHIGSDHHQFTVTEKEAIELADGLLDIYDEPYADSSAIPTMMVSQLARQQVTVALSGDGGDELFMGYGFYYWARRLSNPFIKALRKPIGKGLYAFGDNRMKRASSMFEYPSKQKRKSHIFSQEQYYFTELEIKSLMKNPGSPTIDEQINYDERSLSWQEQQSFFDIQNYLPEELLVKTDRASMHYGLEVRVPLLDHRLVEFALNLSPGLKLKGNTGKYLLKKVLYDYVPAAIFDRPKWGFAVPLHKWLKGELRYLLDQYLNKQVIEECNLVYADKALQIKNDFLNGKDYLYARVWALVILHKWYKENRN